ncbi:MAG TPA: helix-turn-helix transcriptional regulator [Caproiciproducens sp.]|nr:helix-turn-helix transcriptional regulator [Caproiciproducens sp.]
MPTFSEELQKLIRERDTKIYVLAASSGIDRTLIHKFIKGERLPSGRNVVEKLSSVLLLTPEETKKLTESFYFSKMGAQVYARYRLVADLLGRLQQALPTGNPSEYFDPPPFPPHCSEAYGSLCVNGLVKTVLEQEASKPAGRIRMIVQPEYRFLYDILSLSAANHRELKIEQILCLESSYTGDDSFYNLRCFQTVLPVLLSGCDYRLGCYYDKVSCHVNSMSLLPYMILTENTAIRISYDISYAFLSHDPDYLSFCSNAFEGLRSKTSPVFGLLSLQSPGDTASVIKEYGEPDSICSRSPSAAFFIPESLRTEGASSEKQPAHPSARAKTLYFMESGLDDFLESGETPGFMADPDPYPDFQSRRALLNDLCKSAAAGSCYPALINPELLSVPKQVCILSFQNAAAFIFPCRGGFQACILKEKSLLYAFQNFFQNLADSSFVLTGEETLSVLKKKLQESHRSRQDS